MLKEACNLNQVLFIPDVIIHFLVICWDAINALHNHSLEWRYQNTPVRFCNVICISLMESRIDFNYGANFDAAKTHQIKISIHRINKNKVILQHRNDFKNEFTPYSEFPSTSRVAKDSRMENKMSQHSFPAIFSSDIIAKNADGCWHLVSDKNLSSPGALQDRIDIHQLENQTNFISHGRNEERQGTLRKDVSPSLHSQLSRKEVNNDKETSGQNYICLPDTKRKRKKMRFQAYIFWNEILDFTEWEYFAVIVISFKTRFLILHPTENRRAVPLCFEFISPREAASSQDSIWLFMLSIFMICFAQPLTRFLRQKFIFILKVISVSICYSLYTSYQTCILLHRWVNTTTQRIAAFSLCLDLKSLHCSSLWSGLKTRKPDKSSSLFSSNCKTFSRHPSAVDKLASISNRTSKRNHTKGQMMKQTRISKRNKTNQTQGNHGNGFEDGCNEITWSRETRYGKSPFSKLPVLIFVISILILGVGGACPRHCTCKWKGGKQTVECVNKGLTTIPEGMDHGTQVLDLTGNPLVIISREKFKVLGLTNLQRIYANRCKLVQLDDTSFRSLSNLVELDLSENELRLVPAAALAHVPSLMRLQLSYNPITNIKDGSFKSLSYLTTLELSSCAITSVEPLAFQGLDRLEWLKIDNNSLVTIPYGMMLPKSLHGVDIHNNRWICDCKLQQLREWLIQYNVPSAVEPKCTGPIRLRNQVIKYVEKNDFACSPEIRPTSLYLDVIEGRNVSFECHVTATPEAQVHWKFNGFPLENNSFVYEEATSMYVYEEKGTKDDETVSHLRIESVSETHTGIFQCIAENQAGKVISNFSLRVSLPPSEPTPEVVVMDHIIYIGVAFVSLVVLVIILICILVIRCCKRRTNNIRSKANIVVSSSQRPRDKQVNNRAKNNVPKYIQIGTPAPKVNGILADSPPISVIENSPYRTEPMNSTHINPDLIADGPDDRVKHPKKKVSIIGVEEVDESGNRTTRKLDDIIEESEDNYDPNSDRIEIVSGYGSTLPTNGVTYSATLTKNSKVDLNQFPLTNLQHSGGMTHPGSRFYDNQGFPADYGLPRDPNWRNITEVEIPQNFSPVPSEHSSIYSTIRGSVTSADPQTSVLQDVDYTDEISLAEANHHQFNSQNALYHRNFDFQTHTAVRGLDKTFCDCCHSVPPTSQQDYPSEEHVGGRVRGDGCSFDNILTSCGGAAHCCYNEKSTCSHHLFDNLSENYRSLERNPPPPPEGYGDSEDEDAAKDKEWCDGAQSPGTRILYSPEDTYTSSLVESALPENLP